MRWFPNVTTTAMKMSLVVVLVAAVAPFILIQQTATLLACALVPIIAVSLRRWFLHRSGSCGLLFASAIVGEITAISSGLGVIEDRHSAAVATQAGAIVALALLSAGMITEIVPLMPAVNRRRALLDSTVAPVLLAASAWNILLILGKVPRDILCQSLTVALLVLLFVPTAFAAAGLVNDPTDRRLKRLTASAALLTISGVSGLVGPAIGHTSWVFQTLAFVSFTGMAVAIGSDSTGTREPIDLTYRLRRRKRVTTVLQFIFLTSLFAAMWASPAHRVMGVITAAGLLLTIAVQRSAADENLQLTSQLAHQLDNLATSEDRFRELAETDELTGLLNRRAFVSKLEDELTRDVTCSVIFFDLDRFKEVNDSLGHDAGDELLVKLSERLRNTVGGIATIARLGGDEFVVLVPDTPSEGSARAAGEKVLSIFAEPVILDGSRTFAAASVGVACSTGKCTPANMLSRADAAMYSAKSSGRNRVVVFSEHLQGQAADRLRTANELHLAIQRGELRVHYQPIVRLGDSSLAGFEALVRWEHPERGLVFPDYFLDVAEDTGLIVDLGAFVLHESCQQLGTWIREGVVPEDTTVSVNLAPRQLNDPRILSVVTDALVTAGIPATCLVIELTESALMSESKEVDIIVGALGDLGVMFSVDDFGTGYSSLTYLKRFPIQVLKLDQGFVRGLPDDPDDLAIVNAVVGLATGMGFMCVAEGIEEEPQAAYLRTLGCSHGQGYLFARAMPPDGVEKWVEADATLRSAIATSI